MELDAFLEAKLSILLLRCGAAADIGSSDRQPLGAADHARCQVLEGLVILADSGQRLGSNIDTAGCILQAADWHSVGL